MNHFSDDCIKISINPTAKQTFIGIWFRDKNTSLYEQNQMISCLNRTFFYYKIFDDLFPFVAYAKQLHKNAEVFVIISHHSLYAEFAHLCQRYSSKFIKIYLYLSIETSKNACFKTSCKKILFERLSHDIIEFVRNKYPANTIGNSLDEENDSKIYRHFPIGSISTKIIEQQTPMHILDKDVLKFLFHLTMTDILCNMPSTSPIGDQSEMWNACRRLYSNNHAQLDHIDELEKDYKIDEVVRYYTSNSCLSRVINQAFHTENMQYMYTFRCFIHDLYVQLRKLKDSTVQDNNSTSIRTVYRGKMFSGSTLQQLIDNKNGLIILNGFISTSKDLCVASLFYGEGQTRLGYSSVLFKITMDSSITHPFADIYPRSDKPAEAEILLSPGIIWRIDSFTDEDNLYTFNLSPSTLHTTLRTQLMKLCTNNSIPLLALADILREIGDDKQAEWFYDKILADESTSINNGIRKDVFYTMANMRMQREDYSIALDYFNKSAKLARSNDPVYYENGAIHPFYTYENNNILILIHNNRGLLYAKYNRYHHAIKCFEEALSIRGSSVDLARVNNNLGVVYYENGDYQKSYNHHLTATQLIANTHRLWPEFKRNLDRANYRRQPHN